MKTHPTTAGTTLLEVVIASSLFVAFVALVMEAQISNAQYVAYGETQDEVTAEVSSVFDAIGLDLTASGWCFSAPTTDHMTPATDRTLHYLPFAQIQDPTGVGLMPEALGTTFAYAVRSSANGDSFPFIPPSVLPRLAGSPMDATTRFTDSNRLALSAADRTIWATSYLARSQELLFVKATVAIWDHVNDRLLQRPNDKPALYFTGERTDWEAVAATTAAEEAKRARLRILYASGWQPIYDGAMNITGYTPQHIYRYNTDAIFGTQLNPVSEGDVRVIPYGVVMESGWLSSPDEDLADIAVNWRTIDNTAFTSASQDPANGNLAEYGYAVVRSPIGLGRLVRSVRVRLSLLPTALQVVGVEPGQLLPVADAVAAGDHRMRVEAILSDNVVRAVFDTVRTVDADTGPTVITTLDYNTVRARIWFARVSQANAAQVETRLVERVFTMRAQNTANDKDPQVPGSNASILGTNPIGLPY